MHTAEPSTSVWHALKLVALSGLQPLYSSGSTHELALKGCRSTPHTTPVGDGVAVLLEVLLALEERVLLLLTSTLDELACASTVLKVMVSAEDELAELAESVELARAENEEADPVEEGSEDEVTRPEDAEETGAPLVLAMLLLLLAAAEEVETMATLELTLLRLETPLEEAATEEGVRPAAEEEADSTL